ncbi:MAG: hypothetical protein KDN22_27195 [Verrucomicrobiae bacterium]|nr:hypothetical protein [Verrucomicrobiae bacterium]
MDEALEQLSAIDRDVLMLHYFEGWSFKEIAARLGTKSEAAQKRSVRAIVKLTRLLQRRGIAVPAGLIIAQLTAELSNGAISVSTSTLASAAIAGSSTVPITQTLIMSMTIFKKSGVAGTIFAIVLGGMIGLGTTIGVARLMGPIQSPGPEAVVVGYLNSESNGLQTDSNSESDYEQLIAAWKALMQQYFSTTGRDEQSRVMAAARALFAAEPEGFWLALKRGVFPVSTLATRIRMIVNFAEGSSGLGTAGAVVAMEFLERGYAKGAEELEGEEAGEFAYLVELAARDHPERCVRWMEEQADGKLGYRISRSCYSVIPKMHEHLQERIVAAYEQGIATRIASGEPLSADDVGVVVMARSPNFLNGSYRTLGTSDPRPYFDRMFEAILPGVSSMKDKERYGYAIVNTRRSQPIPSLLDKLGTTTSAVEKDYVLAALAGDRELRQSVRASGVSLTEEQRVDFVARDILDFVSEQVNSSEFGSGLKEKLTEWKSPQDWPAPSSSKVYASSRSDSSLSIARSLLLESDDLDRTLSQLDQLPEGWRALILTDVVKWWANHDVVAASGALAKLEDIPDTAIVELIGEIAGDPESATEWASLIKDPELRDRLLNQSR